MSQQLRMLALDMINTDQEPISVQTYELKEAAGLHFLRRAIDPAQGLRMRGRKLPWLASKEKPADLKARLEQQLPRLDAEAARLTTEADGTHRVAWTLELDTLDGPEAEWCWTSPQGLALWVETDRRSAHATLFTSRRWDPDRLLGELVRAIRPADESSSSRGPLKATAWARDKHGGGQSTELELTCPSWDEIRANYPAPAPAIDGLAGLTTPHDRGRIIFWHGPPGTGKTTAILGLLDRWRETMHAEVISDPEHLFTDVDYLHEVLLESHDRPEDKGRLIIAEDSGDLLLASSRSERGHLMARLLNFTDGLLSQGLRVVFLLTTNEDASAVDPAFLRPGRCLQSLEFPLFTPSQATAWLREQGVEQGGGQREASLADLYAGVKRTEKQLVLPTNRIGFATPPTSNGTTP